MVHVASEFQYSGHSLMHLSTSVPPIVEPNVEAVGDALEDVVSELSVRVTCQLNGPLLWHQRGCHHLEPVRDLCSADPPGKLTEVCHVWVGATSYIADGIGFMSTVSFIFVTPPCTYLPCHYWLAAPSWITLMPFPTRHLRFEPYPNPAAARSDGTAHHISYYTLAQF